MSKHLFYYWKNFYDDRRANRIGRIGVTQGAKKIDEIKESIANHSSSWAICFKSEKNKGPVLIALLSLIEHPVTKFERTKHKSEFYYDPRKSFSLAEPSDSSRRQNYFALGKEILACIPDSARKANLNGAHGLHVLAGDNVDRVILRCLDFKQDDLAGFVRADQWISPQKESNDTVHPTALVDGVLEGTVEPSAKNPDDAKMIPVAEEIAANDEYIRSVSIPELEANLVSVAKQIAAQYQGKPGEDVDAVVKRRLGQGAFRAVLEAFHDARCCLSGITTRQLLIASHIVPWSKSNPFEKTDQENGLLLSVNWDAVFDKGFVTFGPQGEVIFSDNLDEHVTISLGISRMAQLPVQLMTPRRIGYLERHRKNIFEHWKK